MYTNAYAIYRIQMYIYIQGYVLCWGCHISQINSNKCKNKCFCIGHIQLLYMELCMKFNDFSKSMTLVEKGESVHMGYTYSQ